MTPAATLLLAGLGAAPFVASADLTVLGCPEGGFEMLAVGFGEGVEPDLTPIEFRRLLKLELCY